MPLSTKVEDLASRRIVSVDEADTVYKAVTLMAEANIGGIVVTRSGAPVGILTERDLMRKITLPGLDPKKVLAKDIMSAPLVTIRAGESLSDATLLMQEKKIRRLLVEDKGKVVGIFTQRDLERALFDYFMEVASIS